MRTKLMTQYKKSFFEDQKISCRKASCAREIEYKKISGNKKNLLFLIINDIDSTNFRLNKRKL